MSKKTEHMLRIEHRCDVCSYTCVDIGIDEEKSLPISWVAIRGFRLASYDYDSTPGVPVRVDLCSMHSDTRGVSEMLDKLAHDGVHDLQILRDGDESTWERL